MFFSDSTTSKSKMERPAAMCCYSDSNRRWIALRSVSQFLSLWAKIWTLQNAAQKKACSGRSNDLKTRTQPIIILLCLNDFHQELAGRMSMVLLYLKNRRGAASCSVPWFLPSIQSVNLRYLQKGYPAIMFLSTSTIATAHFLRVPVSKLKSQQPCSVSWILSPNELNLQYFKTLSGGPTSNCALSSRWSFSVSKVPMIAHMFGLLASVQMSFSLNMYFKSPTSTSDVFSNQPQKSNAYVLFLPSKLQVVSYFSGCSASLSSKCKTHTCYVSRLCFRKSTSNNPKTGELK